MQRRRGAPGASKITTTAPIVHESLPLPTDKKKEKSKLIRFFMGVTAIAFFILIVIEGTFTEEETAYMMDSVRSRVVGMVESDTDEHGHIHGGNIPELSNERIDAVIENVSISSKMEETIAKLDLNSLSTVKIKIRSIRSQFYERYGGKEEAEAMLERGILTMNDSKEEETKAIRHTAERILRALASGTFTMSFGGYSVTVGRGNLFSQSYPFVLESILKSVFQDLTLDLVVRNSAIGGIPSFPYGWCLPNFLGTDSDVVSWDYGMNEGNGAEAFESYLRQSVTSLKKRPMMIMLDTKKNRVNLLKTYKKNGVLLDSIAVGRSEIIKKDYLEMDEEKRPLGFQKWNEWGAPQGSPGQGPWHPKKKEHEMIGWILAMYFLDALDVAVDMIQGNEKIKIEDVGHKKVTSLPKPEANALRGIPEATIPHLLYGIQAEGKEEEWNMDTISCRTSFLPNIEGKLSSVVASGLTKDKGDDLQSRDDEEYSQGWVLDVGHLERETKRKVQKFGGLGYIDMKNALYGIPESGALSLALPHEGPEHTDHDHKHPSNIKANHWFESLVLCEVNEKRGDKECKPETDLSFTVGGVQSSATQISSAASYLNKPVCISVNIPQDASISEGKDGSILLSVDVVVRNKHVNRSDGACSISHVIWQSH